MLDVILGRRSVRDGFGARAVPREVIESILACGLRAPSSKNAQPWRLHVVQDRTVLTELATAVQTAKDASRYVPIDPATGEPRQWSSTVAESAEVLRSVPLVIVIENIGAFSGGRARLAEATPEALRSALVGYGFELMGLGACLQSLWIAAEAQGLHGVFMGDPLVAEETFRERLGLEGDVAGVLCLGYTTGGSAPKHLEPDRVRWHD